MRKLPLLILALLYGKVIGADLTTVSGQKYENYSVNRVYENGITIFHASGAANIPLSELPDDLRQKYSSEIERIQAESRQKQKQADAILDNQRGSTAESVFQIREKLKKAATADRTITVHDKNGKKHQNCRIQRIGASGLTLWINGTSVYIPFRRVKNMTNGILSAPGFAVNLPNTQTERKTAPIAEVSDTESKPAAPSPSPRPSPSQTTASGKTIYTGPRGGKYYYNSKGNKTYVRRKR